MITQDQLRTVIGSTAYDRDGDKIGKIGQVYFDDDTEQPKWLTVNTGLFGTSENFVPVEGADVQGDGRTTVGYDKAMVKDAPNVTEDGHLSPQEEEQLYRYYSLGGTSNGDERTDLGADDDIAGRDTSGPTTDTAMTRSEERLRVGTETREAGRARLRKYVVTENQQVTVPVSHEEVRVEREPITDTNRGDAYAGPSISEEEHEVTLHAERPVVAAEAVAVERVRLDTETVTEQETVTGDVRKEQIDEVDVDRTADVTRGRRNN